jgi:hypothetical protein
MSCSTKASRSEGSSVSSTTSRATPTESASRACFSGSNPSSTIVTGLASSVSKGYSRRDERERSMLRQIRATTVVSQPWRFSTLVVSERLSRIQASWTASSASFDEPSIR